MKWLKIYIPLMLVTILAIIAVYYLSDKNYLEGKMWHYQGESEINDRQLADLVTNGIRSRTLLNKVEKMEDGNILIEYDFYDDIQFDFITKKPFSYFDTPLIHFFTDDENKYMWLGLIVAGIVIGIIIILSSKFSWIKKTQNIPRNILWYIFNPLMIFKHEKEQSACNYKSDIREEILVEPSNGIICTRSWKYRDGFLYSTGIGHLCWKSKVEYSNVIPSEENANGLYLFNLLIANNTLYSDEIIGIVLSKGNWIEHEDGVVRSEYCELLHLIVSDKERAYILSGKYGVPVTISEKPIKAFYKWLFSENGYRCARHTFEIMEETENGKHREGEAERVYKVSAEAS